MLVELYAFPPYLLEKTLLSLQQEMQAQDYEAWPSQSSLVPSGTASPGHSAGYVHSQATTLLLSSKGRQHSS